MIREEYSDLCLSIRELPQEELPCAFKACTKEVSIAQGNPQRHSGTRYPQKYKEFPCPGFSPGSSGIYRIIFTSDQLFATSVTFTG